MKVVYKPWGKEEWLELNDRYCYKRIYINSSHRTSYQYHEHKLETNYIVSGTAEIWLENDEGVIDKTIMKAGDFFTVKPPRKHRVIAITDIVLQEVSTPEVDDVIRISDDANRKDGKLEREHKIPALCIVAAGLGTRMGNYSKIINKGLLPINNEAVISNIINKTPKEYDIVVAVGYKSELIKEYCSAAHSDRNITFVDVQDYDGEFSGPGTSLLACKEHLQRPFYFITSDCYINGELPELDNNWLGVYQTSLPEKYSTVDVDRNHNIINFKNKSIDGYGLAFVGLCSILEYDIFWKELQKNIGNSGEMVSAFYDIKEYNNFTIKELDWYDIGTIDNYLKAKKIFDKEIYGIPKVNGQFVYRINGKFIKLFSQETVEKKIYRTTIISELIPKIIFSGEHTFSYEWFDGKPLYNTGIDIWKKFLEWSKENLWLVEQYNLRDDCIKFYKDKTIKRYESFKNNKTDDYFHSQYIINNVVCENLIDSLEYDDIFDGFPTKLYHGDLQFDNVLYNEYYDNFCLIDWRESFGDSNDYGDVYYDLAKMYGGIIMSYSLMKDQNNYTFSKEGNYITYAYKVDSKLEEFKKYYEKWIITNGYDLVKIKKITAIIYMNMAPLHSDNFDDLLYFHSLKMLNEIKIK